MSMVTTYLKQPKAKVNAALERDICHSRASGICQRCTIRRSTHAHHILPRSQGGADDASNLLACCETCHAEIHAAPADAYREGWMRRKHPRPGDHHFQPMGD